MGDKDEIFILTEKRMSYEISRAIEGKFECMSRDCPYPPFILGDSIVKTGRGYFYHEDCFYTESKSSRRSARQGYQAFNLRTGVQIPSGAPMVFRGKEKGDPQHYSLIVTTPEGIKGIPIPGVTESLPDIKVTWTVNGRRYTVKPPVLEVIKILE